jgi:hypothetical protein
MSTIYFKKLIGRITFILTLVILFLPGCSENYLDENPKNAISESIYWETKADALQALAGIYTNYQGGWMERVQNLDKSMAWLSSWAGYSSWRDFGWTRDVQIDPTHGTVTGMWALIFRQISRANYFLDNVGKVNMDATEKAMIIAEARFLRAFSYFWAGTLYGNIPLITKTITFEEANSITQVTEDAIMNFVVSEMNAIEKDLPLRQVTANKGRIEKGAAMALKGRVQMAQSKWTEAAATYKSIMELNRYIIDPRFKQLFEDEAENTDEFIFANQYMENEYGEAASQFTMRSSLYGGYNSCNVFKHLLDKFGMKDGLPIGVSPMFDPANPYENRDPRLYATVLITGYSKVDGKIFNGDPESIAVTGQTGPNVSGFLCNKFWDQGYKGNWQYYGGDYAQIRYAEVLLSRLECELEAGTAITQSLLDNTINLVRKRAAVNLPIVTETDKTKLMSIVRNERFVELIFEGGIEYFDLRRWKTLKQELDRDILGMRITTDPANYTGKYIIDSQGYLKIGRLNFYDHNYLWPIPLSELDVNKNFKQNPGY